MRGNLVTLCLMLLVSVSTGYAQTTSFTYQGKLTDTGVMANGNFDMEFKLFDTLAPGTGMQQGATLLVPGAVVTSGIFTVTLDFGASVFDGAARFLEISVRPTSGGNFTPLNRANPSTRRRTPFKVWPQRLRPPLSTPPAPSISAARSAGM
jgi:hypothetical protein